MKISKFFIILGIASMSVIAMEMPPKKQKKDSEELNEALNSRNIQTIKEVYKMRKDAGGFEDIDVLGNVISGIYRDKKFPGITLAAVKALLEEGAPATEDALLMAIVTGRLDLIKILLENGAPINSQKIALAMKQYAEQAHRSDKEKGEASVQFESMKELITNEIQKRELHSLEAQQRELHSLEAQRLLEKLNELQLLAPEKLIELQRK